MPYHHQREVREMRHKRRMLFLYIFLFLPLIVAAYFLITFLTSPLDAARTLQVNASYAGQSGTYTDEENISRLMNIISSARTNEIVQSPKPLSEYKTMQLSCTDNLTRESYTFYLCDSLTDCFIVDENKKLFSISEENAKMLFSKEPLLLSRYQTSPFALNLKVGGENFSVAPTYTDWTYVLADGTEVKSAANPSIPTFSAQTDDLALSFATAPSESLVEVKVGDKVLKGSPLQFKSLLPETAGEISVTLTASWNESETASYHGNASYHFLLQYTPEA